MTIVRNHAKTIASILYEQGRQTMKNILKKVTSAILTGALALSLIPALAPTVYAENNTSGGIELGKSATLQDNGTYTINLEAYTTGEETTTTKKMPLDIVLVLDVSGSMGDSFSNTRTYNAQASKGYSYNDISGTNYYYKDGDQYYQVFRDGNNTNGYYLYYFKNYARYYLSGTEVTTNQPTGANRRGTTIWTGVLYTYGTITKLAAMQTAVSSFIEAIVADSTPDAQHQISLIKYADDSYGVMGGNDRDGNGYNLTQITNDWTVADGPGQTALITMVNNFKDGGRTAADYALKLAADQLASNKVRSDAQKVVVFFTDGEPNHSNGFSQTVANSAISSAKTMKSGGALVYTVGILNTTDTGTGTNVGKYMNGMSSNYPNATSINNLGTRTEGASYYKLASNADQLSAIFSSIATDIQSPSIVLGSQSVVKDMISEYFELPEGFNASSNITVYTADCTGVDADGNLIFGTPTVFSAAQVSIIEKTETTPATITVTNFDYKENWCGQRSNGSYSGKKLMITITGILATEEALKNGYLFTNASGSGIYVDPDADDPAQEFPYPEVILYDTVYVLDYAKTTPVPTTLKNPTVLGVNLTDSSIHNIYGTYGTFSLSAEKQLYTPTSTQWTGADCYYAVGKKDGREDNETVWEKVTVLPANNVYYEDSFVSNAAIGSNGADVACTLGIEYSGEWTVTGKDSGNTGSTDTAAQGWIDALADDTGYTDGSAHQYTIGKEVNAPTASATVSFEGTGIDVYTRTDATTGVVLAVLKDCNEGGTQTKLMVLDNKATTGSGYYSVPTLSYTGLPYGLYTVTITVTSTPMTRSEGRYTYYLDGIRIYNPIDPDKEDEVVTVGDKKINAYGNEAGAAFYSLRDMSGLSGSVYVDDLNEAAPFIFTGYYDEDGNEIFEANEDYDPNNSGKTVTLAEAGEFMANNEIYLKAGSTISFNVSGGTHYYLAMKSLTGSEVTANISGTGSITLSHTADMYYELKSGGTVTIGVTGDGILSLTKLKVTGGSVSTYSLEAITGEEGKALAMAFSIDSLPDYYADPIPEEDLTEEVITEPETVEEEPEAPVVEIEEPVLPRENSNALGTLELPGLDFSGRDNARTLVTNILASFRSLLR